MTKAQFQKLVKQAFNEYVNDIGGVDNIEMEFIKEEVIDSVFCDKLEDYNELHYDRLYQIAEEVCDNMLEKICQ